MAWQPTYAIITARAIPDNLIVFIMDPVRQADALTWAGGVNLKLIKTFSIANAARERPVYPLILVRNDDDAQKFGNDLINAAYTVTLEVQATHSDPDQALTNARVYAKAICSMMANIPQATLITGTGAVAAILENILTGFSPIRMNDARNDFLQIIEIRAAYTLNDGGYE